MTLYYDVTPDFRWKARQLFSFPVKSIEMDSQIDALNVSLRYIYVYFWVYSEHGVIS